MKLKNYITAFLATYMFVLMLMPCNDHGNVNECSSKLNIQTAQEHQNDQNDVCSPFCFCACCSTLMNVIDLTATNFISEVSFQQFVRFEQLFLSKEFTFIWQPPKLS